MKRTVSLLLMALLLITSAMPFYAEYLDDRLAPYSVHKVSELPELFGWPEGNIYSIEFKSLLGDQFEAKLIKQPDGKTGIRYTYKAAHDPNLKTNQLPLENGLFYDYDKGIELELASDECILLSDGYGRTYAYMFYTYWGTDSLKLYPDGKLTFKIGGVAGTYCALAPWLRESYSSLDDSGLVLSGNAVSCARIGETIFSANNTSITRWSYDGHDEICKLPESGDFVWDPDSDMRFVYKNGWFYTMQGKVNVKGEFVPYYDDEGYIQAGSLIGANERYLVGYSVPDHGIIRLNYDGSGKTELTRAGYDYSRILSANVYGDTLCCVYINSSGYGAQMVLKAEFIDIDTGAHRDIGLGDLDYAELYGDYLIYYKAGSLQGAPLYVWDMKSGKQDVLLDMTSYSPNNDNWESKYAVCNGYIVYPYVGDSKYIVCSKLDGSMIDEPVYKLEGHDYVLYLESVNGRILLRVGNLYDEAWEKWIDLSDLIPGYESWIKVSDYTSEDGTWDFEDETWPPITDETSGYNEHDHQWIDATCTTARTCSICGAIEGAALGHYYSQATCQKLATCSRCGKTIGGYADHNWLVADCYNPKICTVCGRTEGSALGHNYQYITAYVQQCTRCGNKIGSGPTPTPTPVYRNPQFARSLGIYATSAYASDYYTWRGTKETRSYYPQNAFDNNKDTCWVQYASGHGNFSNVYVGAKWNAGSYNACGFRICIGMQYQGSDSYNRNSRPRQITVKINGKAFDYTLSDTMDWQTFYFPEDVNPSNGSFDMRICVWNVYTDKMGYGYTNKSTYSDKYAVCLADVDLYLK
ncbi:MAG: hypothetical protein IJU28_08575 [Clostridia bacterium]|nr:hypothetical protein [Clostridia bacterium]